MPKTLSVAAIKNGTVIDHIPEGEALNIVHLLQLSSHRVTLGLHLSSTSMGHKDLIKIENRFLSEKEVCDVAVFAPKATIDRIKNYKVLSKTLAQLPATVQRIFGCPNLRCITRTEYIDTLFHIEVFGQKVHVRCHYCEKLFERDAIREYKL